MYGNSKDDIHVYNELRIIKNTILDSTKLPLNLTHPFKTRGELHYLTFVKWNTYVLLKSVCAKR